MRFSSIRSQVVLRRIAPERRSAMMRNAAGFTLAEVLISVAIVAMVSVTIVTSVSGMLAQTQNYSESTQLELLARALVDDMILRGIPEKKTGSFDSHPDYLWEYEVEDETFDSFGAPITLRRVSIRVISPKDRSLWLDFMMER